MDILLGYEFLLSLSWCSKLLLVFMYCFILFCFKFQTGSCYVVQSGFKLQILLPHLAECSDYGCASLHPAAHFFSFSFSFSKMVGIVNIEH